MKNILIILLLIIPEFLFSQNLSNSDVHSPYQYIYKISNEQARNFTLSDITDIDNSYFINKIDSVKYGDEYNKPLPVGHYIKVYSLMSDMMIDYMSVTNHYLTILNNDIDLILQVYDLNGNIASNTQVRIKSKKIKFDLETQSYRIKKANKKGLLSITHDGFTGYQNLARNRNRSLVNKAPIKYVWHPIRFILHLPVDSYKSIRDGWTQGTIYTTKNFFVKAYYKIACIFDDYYCRYDSYENDDNFSGYMVFNKPMYRPGDTVKYKAYILDQDSKPIDKKVNISLKHGYYNNYKKTKLGVLSPYTKGGYSGEFVLADSLDLKLDKYYSLIFTDEEEEEIIAERFKFEDYDLSKIVLDVDIDKYKHYPNDTVKVDIEVKDENDLHIYNSRIDYYLLTSNVSDIFNDEIFVPDTISSGSFDYDPGNKTDISVTRNLFPDANVDYEIKTIVKTSDNRIKELSNGLQYLYNSEELDFEVSNDSIRIFLNKNGKEISGQAKISAYDYFNTKILNDSMVLLPYSYKINPTNEKYKLEYKDISLPISVSSINANIHVSANSTKDSVYFSVKSERGLNFSYFIYEQNEELDRGYTNDLLRKYRINTKKKYYIYIQYLWGGQIQNKTYSTSYREGRLIVHTVQPNKVYPGEKVKFKVHVLDEDNKPVSDADLTAYSFTNKFDSRDTPIPDFSIKKKGKKYYNSFHLIQDYKQLHSKNLDYLQWKKTLAIDTVEYYDFLYPGKSIYNGSTPSVDSTTQFAPFVFKNGNTYPIQVIYLNNEPIYFGWTSVSQPYSFKAPEGYNQIKIRLTNRQITLDSVRFKKGHKHILSIDINKLDEKYKQEKLSVKPNDYEVENLSKYIFRFSKNNEFNNIPPYIEQQNNGRMFFITSMNNNSIGPIKHGSNLTLKTMGSYSKKFKFDSNYEYSFSKDDTKLKSIKRKELFPIFFNTYTQAITLEDRIYTKAVIDSIWKGKINSTKRTWPVYNNPWSTSPNKGSLNLIMNEENNSDLLNILMLHNNNSNFIRVYRGTERNFHNLEEGSYRLIFLYENVEYFELDSIQVYNNGSCFKKLLINERSEKDDFSIKTSKIIENHIYKENRPDTYSKNDIYSNYREKNKYIGSGKFVTGSVFDEEGLPMPGANIVIPNSTYGTTTDFDGHFKLKVPHGVNKLEVSFIGYKSVKAEITANGCIEVHLEADMMALEDVVAAGYGIEEEEEVYNFSIADGVSPMDDGLLGSVAGIQIRGATSVTETNSPLIIINGAIYKGSIDDLKKFNLNNAFVLDPTAAMKIYGSAASNGAIILSTSTEENENEKIQMESYDNSNSLRSNFSDYAYWKPRLKTDENGVAEFEVVFPDDITSWDTHVIAMTENKQAGKAKGNIKSYKPLMARINMPRFVTEGDRLNAIGEVLNYNNDTINYNVKASVNDSILFSNKATVSESNIDTLIIAVGKEDSISIRYQIKLNNGYSDGELRKLPVNRIGLEESKGMFFSLESDTLIQTDFEAEENAKIIVSATAQVLDIAMDELDHVYSYYYDCNEQLASKLKALILKERISKHSGLKFKQKREVKKLIRLLLKNQNENHLWGWWGKSEEELWISIHVSEALIMAEKQGYKSKTDEWKTPLLNFLTTMDHPNRTFDQRIKTNTLKKSIAPSINIAQEIKELETNLKLEKHSKSLNKQLQLEILKKKNGMDPNIDFLKKYKKETLYGNIFFSDAKDKYWLRDDFMNTLLAYELLSGNPKNNYNLSKIRNYFLEEKKSGHWVNTYNSIKALEILVPEFMSQKNNFEKSKLVISGDDNQTVSEFPFNKEYPAGTKLNFEKEGKLPVFVSLYKQYWNANPKTKEDLFSIKTNIGSSLKLEAGKEFTYKIDVEVKKQSEYIMLKIPISSGFSYISKERACSRYEVHREYFKDHVAIFFNKLKVGNYSFDIKLMPRFTGEYTLNPVQMEQMYFPVFNGNNKVKQVELY